MQNAPLNLTWGTLCSWCSEGITGRRLPSFQQGNQALETGTETRQRWVSSLEFAEGILPSPGKPGPILVAPSRREHRSDVRKRSTTNQGPVSVLRSRGAVISRGEFYWILLAVTGYLSDKVFRGRQPGLGSHVVHVVNETSIRCVLQEFRLA